MIDITYMPLKNVNKLRLLYGEGHIKALAGKVFWIRENEKRYITEVVIDIKTHTPRELKLLAKPPPVSKIEDVPEDTFKWKECENCGYKAEKEPEVDFLVCPMCDTDLEELEVDEEVVTEQDMTDTVQVDEEKEVAADLRRKYDE